MSKSADELQRAKWLSLLRIVLVYAGFASLWILLSDEAVLLVTTEPHRMVQISQYKGWAFVLITSLLLLWLLTRHWKKYVAALREQIKTLQLLQDLANSSSDAIFAKDLQGRYLLFNRAACDIVGKRLDEVLGQDDRSLFPPEQARSLLETEQRLRAHGVIETLEETVQTTLGERVFIATKGPLRDAHGQIIGTFGISRDITDRKLAEAEIAHLAYHDQLTGLPNRLLLEDRLQQALGVARRAGLWGGLLFVDLDHFKRVNDNFGHVAGDAMIREVAQRLVAHVRLGDTVARMAGDEFIILLPGLAATEAAAAALALGIGEKLRLQIAEPMHLPAGHFEVTASVGVSLFPKAGLELQDLLREADTALHRVKETGRNALILFAHEMHQAVAEHYALEQDLRRALAQGELRMYLQAKVDAHGEVWGAEALLRWQHPTRGWVSPGQFIPIAEDSGLIVTVGAWVLDQACELIAREAEAGRVLRIAVNVSPRQFLQSDLVGHVRQTLSRTGIDPRCLTLEITEGLLLKGTAEVLARMEELATMGLRFSIDDFGTGYSSLAYLKRLPLHELKIDQSFVRDVPRDGNDVAVIEAIVSIAHHMGFKVVAEGVESAEQQAFLIAQGCDYFQGFLHHRPEPATAWQERGGPTRLSAAR
ncbi:putative bifunctional diguanylate cyclase/phosphodiesterase [Roseateles sp.]|uniref:putative bifunctional diguanylate cyclase/phosphodiesterase n=1 Tax=Roseateles sp. TaxID=1971397 RepID=UPI003933DB63